MRRTLKFLTVAVTAAVPAIAGAQSVNFVGATRGCFYSTTVCTPSGTFGTGSASLISGGLTRVVYNFGSFNVFTQPSTPSGISGVAIGGATADNYGTISVPLNASGFNTAGQHLVVQWQIASPTLNGGSPFTVSRTYNLLGAIGTSLGSGGTTVLSSYAPGVNDLYTGPFTNGVVAGGGTASGTVDDWSWDTINVTTGHTAPLTGRVDITSAVPEPATLALMLTGVLALAGAGVVRRRSA